MRRFSKLASLSTKASQALTLALGLTAGTAAFGALCDESYHLQEAKQYLYSTSSVTEVGTPAITTLKTDLSDAKILFDSSAYQVMVGFDGACGAFTQKEIRFRIRNKGEAGFKDAKVNDLYIRMYDSNTVLNGTPYAYWFGFSQSPDTLVYAVGMPKGDGAQFSTWYAIALLADSTRDANSGLWSSSFSYQLRLSGPGDSAALATNALKGWKDITFDANHKGAFQVQMIRVSYDSKPTGLGGVRTNPKANPSLLVHQNGEQIRLTLAHSAVNMASVELFDMFGRQVAQLHPTGGEYLWNGKTQAGNAAPGGVYFAQSQNRVLGKFFYNR